MESRDAVESLEEPLKGLATGTPRAADLKGFENNASQPGDSPSVNRRAVNLLSLASSGEKLRGGREGK